MLGLVSVLLRFKCVFNPRIKLRDEKSLRGEGRRREGGGYGVGNSGRDLRHSWPSQCVCISHSLILESHHRRSKLILAPVVVMTRRKMIRPGLEPGTFCVLDRCDNQLRHRTACHSSPPIQRERERRRRSNRCFGRKPVVKIHGIETFRKVGRSGKGM